jgi:acyl carrier protein/acyl-coenzyme A synthetase/AMP-(fatty) acid ligase
MELMNGLGYCMHNGYGMSEIGITSVELRSRPKYRNLNTVGRPFDSVEYRLEDGLLQVRGSSLCTRKLVNGQEERLEGWFSTGDNMTCRDGYYSILGRQGDVVIGENGENINPDAVEKLFLLGKAKLLSVLGLPGENGQELSMVVQLSPYATEQTVEAIRQEVYAVNQTLPTASAIRKFYFTTDELAPPTAVKVSRPQLQKKIAEGQVRLVSFAEHTAAAAEGADSPLMEDVKKIIASVLDVPADTVEATSHIFFDLGGSSIQYFSILTELSKHFEISGYEQTDKYCYTPKEICEYIERRM